MANVVEDLQRGTAAINDIEAALKAKGVIGESEEVPVEDFDDRIEEIGPSGPIIEFSSKATEMTSGNIELKKVNSVTEKYKPNEGAQSCQFQYDFESLSIEQSDIDNMELKVEMDIPPVDISNYDTNDSIMVTVQRTARALDVENLKINLRSGYETNDPRTPVYQVSDLLHQATINNVELILQNVAIPSSEQLIDTAYRINNIYIKIDPHYDSNLPTANLYGLAEGMTIDSFELDSSDYGVFEKVGNLAMDCMFKNATVGKIKLNLDNLADTQMCNLFKDLDLSAMTPSTGNTEYPITITGNCPYYFYYSQAGDDLYHWTTHMLWIADAWAINDNGTIKEYIDMKKLIKSIENMLEEHGASKFINNNHTLIIYASDVVDTTMYDENLTVEEKLEALGVVINRDNA